MFFSDNNPISSSSFRICFLFTSFSNDFLIFAISKVETLLLSDGISILFTSVLFFTKGSLLKLLLSVPYFEGSSTGRPKSFSSYPVGT